MKLLAPLFLYAIFVLYIGLTRRNVLQCDMTTAYSMEGYDGGYKGKGIWSHGGLYVCSSLLLSSSTS